MRARRIPVVALLVGWTFLVWTTRIGNIWRDAELDTGDRWGRTALALSFTVLALVVVVGQLRRTRWRHGSVLALAGWTTGVWVLRSIGIVTGDHGTGFVVVHLVLAAVSIALAAAAIDRRRHREPDLSPAAGRR